MKFPPLSGRMTALSALAGAGAIAALALPHPGTDIDARTARATVPAAGANATAPSSIAHTSVAVPPVLASPCQPREVLPCLG